MGGTDERICLDGSDVVCDGDCENCRKPDMFNGSSHDGEKYHLCFMTGKSRVHDDGVTVTQQCLFGLCRKCPIGMY